MVLVRRFIAALRATGANNSSSVGAASDVASGDLEDIQAAQIVVDTAYKRLSDEISRTKDLDGKAAPILGFASALTVLSTSTFAKAPNCLIPYEVIIYYVGIGIGILVLGAAQIYLLKVLSLRDYKHINLDKIAIQAQTRRKSNDLHPLLEGIAGSYYESTYINMEKNDAKALNLVRGIRLVITGAAIITVTLLYPSCGLPRLWG